MLDSFFFWAFAMLVLGGALFTVTLRNPVHCAISLIVSLSGVAGIFLLQGAEFLFASQIIAYVGGVVTLFLFVIMLVNLDISRKDHRFQKQWPIAVVIAVTTAGLGAALVRTTPAIFANGPVIAGGGNTELVAMALLGEYLLPFEIVSLVLLVAVVGSVFLARGEA